MGIKGMTPGERSIGIVLTSCQVLRRGYLYQRRTPDGRMKKRGGKQNDSGSGKDSRGNRRHIWRDFTYKNRRRSIKGRNQKQPS